MLSIFVKLCGENQSAAAFRVRASTTWSVCNASRAVLWSHSRTGGRTDSRHFFLGGTPFLQRTWITREIPTKKGNVIMMWGMELGKAYKAYKLFSVKNSITLTGRFKSFHCCKSALSVCSNSM